MARKRVARKTAPITPGSHNTPERREFVSHVNGRPWYEAPLPPWRHKCQPHTVTGCMPRYGEHQDEDHCIHMLLCACGGWAWPGRRPLWGLRNGRRIASYHATAALLSEVLAAYFIYQVIDGVLDGDPWFLVVINVLALLVQLWLFGANNARTGGRSWDGATPEAAIDRRLNGGA